MKRVILKIFSTITLLAMLAVALPSQNAQAIANNSRSGSAANAPADYTLQILHYYGESGMLGVQTAPILGALIDKFNDQYANNLVLGEGDSYIPGPWLIGGADPSLNSMSGIGTTALGRPDIAIMNAFGTNASALGNHEFDLGSPVLQSAIQAAPNANPALSWPGAQFPLITANLDFSADSSLKALADVTLGGTGGALAGQEASAIKARIAPYAIVTVNGEPIGIVGATTYELLTKTSPNGTKPKDDGNPSTDDLQEVAAYVQSAVDALTLLGVDKIVMVDQLDTIDRNKLLAPMVSGIDVMVAGGGHERMGDANDTAVGFNGHTADFVADAYPIVTAGSDSKPILLVTTDTEYTYLGRLVVDFDVNGVLIPGNLNNTVNGAYAATEANLQAAYATANTASQIIATSTIGTQVNTIVQAISSVITAKDGTIWGYTNVYLEGDRALGRVQEVNLGDITADANIYVAELALGGSGYITSLKNGGGLRASIGAIDEDGGKISTIANPLVGKPAGAISTLDVENALRFDNKLMVFDTTPLGLKNILEYAAGLSSGSSQQNGGYMQIGGLRVSYNYSSGAGNRVKSIALTDRSGKFIAGVYENGAFTADAPAAIKMVILNFTANGGDGYPVKANGDNFRFLLTDGTLGAPVDEALDFTAVANVPANALGEQKAFQNYLKAVHDTPAKAYTTADTPIEQDQRIQILPQKAEDTVFPAPTVVSITRAGANPANSASVDFTVTFSEAMTGVDVGDFSVTTSGLTGAVTSVSGSGATYTVTASTGTGNGSIRLNIPNTASITDLLSHALSGLPYTSGQTYSIVRSQSFTDVNTSYWAWPYIERLYIAGITSGCSTSPLSYCPGSTVTRAQMAVFLERSLHGSAYTPPNVSPTFSDTAGHWAEDWIEALKNDGLTSGCSTGKYCPDDSVTRAQMAVLLLRGKYGAAYNPPNVSATFGDTSGHWAEDWIEKLAADGITSGCGAGIYCPDGAVTRDQMAVFLVKTFILP